MGFQEDTGAPVEGRMYRAWLLLLVQGTHAACAILRMGLLGDCAQRHLGVVTPRLLTALFVTTAASQFLLLITPAGFWLMRLELEPRRGRLRGGWG